MVEVSQRSTQIENANHSIGPGAGVMVNIVSAHKSCQTNDDAQSCRASFHVFDRPGTPSATKHLRPSQFHHEHHHALTKPAAEDYQPKTPSRHFRFMVVLNLFCSTSTMRSNEDASIAINAHNHRGSMVPGWLGRRTLALGLRLRRGG